MGRSTHPAVNQAEFGRESLCLVSQSCRLEHYVGKGRQADDQLRAPDENGCAYAHVVEVDASQREIGLCYTGFQKGTAAVR